MKYLAGVGVLRVPFPFAVLLFCDDSCLMLYILKVNVRHELLEEMKR